jgi:hypothetical protein
MKSKIGNRNSKIGDPSLSSRRWCATGNAKPNSVFSKNQSACICAYSHAIARNGVQSNQNYTISTPFWRTLARIFTASLPIPSNARAPRPAVTPLSTTLREPSTQKCYKVLQRRYTPRVTNLGFPHKFNASLHECNILRPGARMQRAYQIH